MASCQMSSVTDPDRGSICPINGLFSPLPNLDIPVRGETDTVAVVQHVFTKQDAGVLINTSSH